MNPAESQITALVKAHLEALESIFGEWSFTPEQKIARQTVLAPFKQYFPQSFHYCKKCGILFDYEEKFSVTALGLDSPADLCEHCEDED